jgi:hypothetical protein
LTVLNRNYRDVVPSTPPNAQVNIKTLVAGFDGAHARLQADFNRHAPPDEMFLSLFEALHWAVAIGYFAKFKLNVSVVGNKDDWLALKFARNKTGHQWGMALRLATDVPFAPGLVNLASSSSRVRPPTVVMDWVWVDGAAFKRSKDARKESGRPEYVNTLEGKQARAVLQRFAAALDTFR